MTTHYHSASSGPIEIAGMKFPHLESSYAKLKHQVEIGQEHAERQAEVDAMRAEILKRRAAWREENMAVLANPASTDEEKSVAADKLATLDAKEANFQ